MSYVGVSEHARAVRCIADCTSHVTRHTSHVTRHTSHVTRHTSHVARHTSHLAQVLDTVTLSALQPGISISSYFGAVDNITMGSAAHLRQQQLQHRSAAAATLIKTRGSDPDFYPVSLPAPPPPVQPPPPPPPSLSSQLGMWGLAYPALNVEKSPPLFDAFVQQSSPRARDVFALCLGLSTGIMTLGGEGSSHEESSVAFTPIVSKEGYYTVWMDSVAVDGVPLNTTEKVLNKRGAIVDSGTVLPTLPTQAFQALRQRFELLCRDAHWRGVCRDLVAANATLFDGVCYNYTLAELSTFPRVSFALRNNVTIDLPPSLYMRNNRCAPASSPSPPPLPSQPYKHFVTLLSAAFCVRTPVHTRFLSAPTTILP